MEMSDGLHWRRMTPGGWETFFSHDALDGLGTGIQDQEGKEIFVGDILEFRDRGKYPFRMEVCFGRYHQPNCDKEGYGFYVKHENPKNYFREDFMYWTDKVRIIGNVVQNPELRGARDDGEL